MTFDELQNSWKSQENDMKLKIKPEILLKEVKRNHKNFESTYFWSHVIVVVVCLFCSMTFLFFGIKSGLWPFYLLTILCLFVSLFIGVDIFLQKKKRPRLSCSLSDFVNSSLVLVDHQIWLNRKALWWLSAPIGVGLIMLFGYFHSLIMIAVVAFISLSMHWVLQWEIAKKLKPRKDELEELLTNLKDCHPEC